MKTPAVPKQYRGIAARFRVQFVLGSSAGRLWIGVKHIRRIGELLRLSYELGETLIPDPIAVARLYAAISGAEDHMQVVVMKALECARDRLQRYIRTKEVGVYTHPDVATALYEHWDPLADSRELVHFLCAPTTTMEYSCSQRRRRYGKTSFYAVDHYNRLLFDTKKRLNGRYPGMSVPKERRIPLLWFPGQCIHGNPRTAAEHIYSLFQALIVPCRQEVEVQCSLHPFSLIGKPDELRCVLKTLICQECKSQPERARASELARYAEQLAHVLAVRAPSSDQNQLWFSRGCMLSQIEFARFNVDEMTLLVTELTRLMEGLSLPRALRRVMARWGAPVPRRKTMLYWPSAEALRSLKRVCYAELERLIIDEFEAAGGNLDTVSRLYHAHAKPRRNNADGAGTRPERELTHAHKEPLEIATSQPAALRNGSDMVRWRDLGLDRSTGEVFWKEDSVAMMTGEYDVPILAFIMEHGGTVPRRELIGYLRELLGTHCSDDKLEGPLKHALHRISAAFTHATTRASEFPYGIESRRKRTVRLWAVTES